MWLRMMCMDKLFHCIRKCGPFSVDITYLMYCGTQCRQVALNQCTQTRHELSFNTFSTGEIIVN